MTGIAPGVGIRLLAATDAGAMSAAYLRNRGHLAPWEPERLDPFFTASHQLDIIHAKRAHLSAGTEVPWVLVDTDQPGSELHGDRIVGAITLTGIVRGPFLSANLGYWVDRDLTGRGIATAGVRYTLGYAGAELGLHRVQAATVVHNAASRRILDRTGFQEIGLAPNYLKIAGKWQDHLLHQVILPQAVSGLRTGPTWE